MDSFAFSENLLNLAAVIYQPNDDIDRILASFAARLRSEGHRIGGVVQRNRRGDCGPANLMAMIDLMTDQTIPICQDLGAGSKSCRLDHAGLADAAQAVRRAVADDMELVIVNKFGKTEAVGRGMRVDIADAVVAGMPVLTAVSERLYPAWRDFTAGFGTTLFCDGAVIDDWWRDTSRRASSRRLIAATGTVSAMA